MYTEKNGKNLGNEKVVKFNVVCKIFGKKKLYVVIARLISVSCKTVNGVRLENRNINGK